MASPEGTLLTLVVVTASMAFTLVTNWDAEADAYERGYRDGTAVETVVVVAAPPRTTR